MTADALKLLAEEFDAKQGERLTWYSLAHAVRAALSRSAPAAVPPADAPKREQDHGRFGGKPVRLVVNGCINDLQRDSIAELIRMAKGASRIDIKVRKNGQEHWLQADWLWHTRIDEPPADAQPAASAQTVGEGLSEDGLLARASAALAALYQVLGVLASSCGTFGLPQVDKALTVASDWEGMRVADIEALLPWPDPPLPENRADDLEQQVSDLTAQRDQLQRELAEAQRDAQRYRWLRTRINWSDKDEGYRELRAKFRAWTHHDYRLNPPKSEHIDDYIDGCLAALDQHAQERRT